jgi:hypothetical protein
MVRPILEYSADIWAGEITDSLAARAEAVQTNFARSMLGLIGCQSISNDALRAKMGMEKLSSLDETTTRLLETSPRCLW